MILFVRAANGKVNHIQLHHRGVDTTPRLRNGVYHTAVGDFTVDVGKDDKVTVKLNGKKPVDWSIANDLHRFAFPDEGEPDNTPALSAVVSDGVRAGDRVGG